ncbi:MAG: 3D domain-containing protein [Defluviitaleaceae bacterium]|nr:3D domain-containing protein [Defluviitaleaceae bacterium]
MARKIQVVLFLLALMAIFATTASADSAQPRIVRLTTGTESQGFTTFATTVGEFLEIQGIRLNSKDILNMDLDAALPVGTTTNLNLRRSFFINIVIDNDEIFEYEIGPAQRVGHIIAELREELGIDFAHNGLLNDVIIPESTLYLTSRTIMEYILTTNVQFEREVRGVRGLLPGETKMFQEGVFGELTTVIQVIYVAGEEVDRSVVSMTKTRQPVREIVFAGEYDGTVVETLASARLAPGTVMSVSGIVSGFDYVYSVIMESTAYSAQQPGLSNYTASGHRAVRGVIAVDPSVIPLGTWVYVEGYGRALASDTGGAIRGNKIDLCFDTVAEAIQHGRRNVRVWILRD